MKSNSSSKKRIRRSEEQLIEALQSKIAALEERKARRAVKADPTLRLANKLVKSLKNAETIFLKAGRMDLANSVKAAAISLGSSAIPR